jgi:hypothetical protein
VALALIEALMGSEQNVKSWIVSVKDAIIIINAIIHEQPYVINVLVRQQVKSKCTSRDRVRITSNASRTNEFTLIII